MKTLDLFQRKRVWLAESLSGADRGELWGRGTNEHKGAYMVIPGAHQAQSGVRMLATQDEMPLQRPAC